LITDGVLPHVDTVDVRISFRRTDYVKRIKDWSICSREATSEEFEHDSEIGPCWHGESYR
jgi:hypothetical protein